MGDIIIENICKSFDKKTVLRGLSAVIPEGSVTRIQGISGCGKTTLLRIITGLEKPDSGRIITYKGVRFGVQFQEDRLSDCYSALDNLRFVSRLPGYTLLEMLGELNINADPVKDPVSSYSGGMKRRLSLARAIACRADVLILDEPFTGMDPDTVELSAAFAMKHKAGRTLIYTSHNDSHIIPDQIIRLDSPQI